MADAVSTIVTPADVDRPKPAPDMLEAAAGALKVEPGDMLVIGDTTADLAMADAGGAASVLVVPPGSPAPSAHGAVAVIASLEQIELLGTAT
jgi:phosphoglycolate phosphatase-like HAD superfamily hydrolase